MSCYIIGLYQSEAINHSGQRYIHITNVIITKILPNIDFIKSNLNHIISIKNNLCKPLDQDFRYNFIRYIIREIEYEDYISGAIIYDNILKHSNEIDYISDAVNDLINQYEDLL
jgi:hypothetical protein